MGNKRQRKSDTNQVKAKVAREAIKGQRTVNEIASDYHRHRHRPCRNGSISWQLYTLKWVIFCLDIGEHHMVNQWKRQAIEKRQEAFSSKEDREAEKEEELRDRPYRESGQLKVELDWLKQNQESTVEQKRLIIDPNNKTICIRRQCELVRVIPRRLLLCPLG